MIKTEAITIRGRQMSRTYSDAGMMIERGGVRMMATYHPSALLRDPSRRPEAFDDLKSLEREIRAVCVRTYPSK